MPSLAVLVATTRTQGQRGSDFAHVPEGELVDLAPACCCDEHEADLDGACGNARAFQGLDSYQATTTAEVAVRSLTVVQYRNLFHRSLITAGYEDEPELRSEAQEDADEMLDYATWHRPRAPRPRPGRPRPPASTHRDPLRRTTNAVTIDARDRVLPFSDRARENGSASDLLSDRGNTV